MDPDLGSGPCYFRHRPSRWQQKTNFNTIFPLLLLKALFHDFSKMKSQKESQNRRIRIQDSQKHVNSVDPDPEHWKLGPEDRREKATLKTYLQHNVHDRQKCHFPSETRKKGKNILNIRI
jgi:hypothetical protein